ncbi:uncharacterized protein MYCFIDRAFT_172403 [Pseudocercospora fijiensis CIRAD86]|uniref:F-box domain-containing protein n=1 Tax=Pseudocercospora fijiensis (strain CIRAD86) TaxID=383855 RepID=M3AQ29_PSEFD|nr:uncharacterized protein MYCFIDRAFT_172403 [Pseudocercospora fijiensis CIRAD86]EME86706.1 hypothetical protein MYCFIDRAFT_172403 [Pseudocercospora fijiensis CIRAD86]
MLRFSKEDIPGRQRILFLPPQQIFRAARDFPSVAMNPALFKGGKPHASLRSFPTQRPSLTYRVNQNRYTRLLDRAPEKHETDVNMSSDSTAELLVAMKRTKLATRFLHLPNELQLATLSNLTAREIQRARRVCRHFNTLIQEPSNSNTLYTRAQNREYERLQADVSNFLNYSNITFIEALRRFSERRGIWSHEAHQRCILEVLVHLWMSQHEHVCAGMLPSFVATHLQRETAWMVAARLLDVHREALLLQPPMYVLPPMAQVCTYSAAARSRAWRMDVAQKALFHKVPSAPSPLLAIPLWPLTPLYYIDQGDHTRGFDFFLGICGQNSLAELLGVPELPAYCNGSFAYCARSQKTYDLVVEGRRKGGMSLVERVRVMEDMFLGTLGCIEERIWIGERLRYWATRLHYMQASPR